MTVDEAEKYADKMTYREAIENALSAKCVPYRRATLTKLHRLLKEFGENVEVLDKTRAEIEKLQKMCDKNDLNLMAQYSAFGMVLDIIDKHKGVSTFDCGKDPG